MSVLSDPSLENVGQSAHVFFAAFLVLAFHGNWYAVGAMVVFAAVKEFWYDENYETADVRGSNLRDFAYYMLGIALGKIVSLI